MDTIYGIPHVLPCSHNEAKSNEYHNGDTVVESEHWRVDVNMADFYQVFQPPENVQHDAAVGCLAPTHDSHTPPQKYYSDTLRNCLKHIYIYMYSSSHEH